MRRSQLAPSVEATTFPAEELAVEQVRPCRLETERRRASRVIAWRKLGSPWAPSISARVRASRPIAHAEPLAVARPARRCIACSAVGRSPARNAASTMSGRTVVDTLIGKWSNRASACSQRGRIPPATDLEEHQRVVGGRADHAEPRRLRHGDHRRAGGLRRVVVATQRVGVDPDDLRRAGRPVHVGVHRGCLRVVLVGRIEAPAQQLQPRRGLQPDRQPVDRASASTDGLQAGHQRDVAVVIPQRPRDRSWPGSSSGSTTPAVRRRGRRPRPQRAGAVPPASYPAVTYVANASRSASSIEPSPGGAAERGDGDGQRAGVIDRVARHERRVERLEQGAPARAQRRCRAGRRRPRAASARRHRLVPR